MSDEVKTQTDATEAQPSPRKLKAKCRKPRPVCRKHGYAMVVGHTHGIVRYYYCPDPNCRESVRQMKEVDLGTPPQNCHVVP